MKQYSGKFILRLLPSLHKKLSIEAGEQGISLNQLINKKLTVKSVAPYSFHSLEKYFKRDLLGLAFFGSFARQQMFKTSDKDLLIVLGSRLPIKRDLYLIWEQHFSKDFPSISPHFTHLPDRKIPLGSLWLEVALEGQIVFEKNQQLSSCLMEIRRDIARGLYQRKQTYGHPYWLKAILKEGTDK